MTNSEQPAIATIPLPSADLIIYRFDQTDRNLKELSNKFDSVTRTFATKEELAGVNQRLNNYRWWGRTLAVAVLTAVLASAASLINSK